MTTIRQVLALDLDISQEMLFAKIKKWNLQNESLQEGVSVNKIGMKEVNFREFI